VNQPLSREDVERFLNEGGRWVVTYCWGADRDPATGRGAPLPPGVVERVPTAAALRKLARGRRRKTYFHAEFAKQGDEVLVALTEG
jgi:hypothetical protein